MGDQLREAAHNGDLAKLADLVELHSSALEDAHPHDGSTPLIIAALNGQAEATKFLVKSGAKIEAKTEVGWTALHCSVYFGHLDTVKVLLELGADVENPDAEMWTPLFYTMKQEVLDVAEVLLEAGANIEAKDSEGKTALAYAAYEAYFDGIEFLVAHGADPESKNNGGGDLFDDVEEEDVEKTKAAIANGLKKRTELGITAAASASLAALSVEENSGAKADEDADATPPAGAVFLVTGAASVVDSDDVDEIPKPYFELVNGFYAATGETSSEKPRYRRVGADGKGTFPKVECYWEPQRCFFSKWDYHCGEPAEIHDPTSAQFDRDHVVNACAGETERQLFINMALEEGEIDCDLPPKQEWFDQYDESESVPNVTYL